MRDIYCTFELIRNSSQESNMKKNTNIRDIEQMQTRMKLTLFALSSFKGMELQRSANSCMLIWRLPNTSKFQNEQDSKHLMKNSNVCYEDIYKIKNWCTKTNLEAATVIQCIKYCFYIFINNWWKCFATIPIPWCLNSDSNNSTSKDM